MKKILLYIIMSIILSSFISAATLLNNDFETGVLGTWTVFNSNMTLNSATPLNGVYSGDYKPTASAGTENAYQTFTTQNTITTAHIEVRNTAADGAVWFGDPDGTTYQDSCYLRCTSNTWRMYDDSVYQDTGVTCAAGLSFAITLIAYDFGSNGRCDVYINNTQELMNIEARGTVNDIGRIGLNGVEDFTIDRIKVCDGNYTTWGDCGEPSPTTSYFDIRLDGINEFNTTINTLCDPINGVTTTLETTNGTINTQINQSCLNTANFVIRSPTYYEKNYTNYNISVDLNTTLDRYPKIDITNRYNGSGVVQSDMRINGILFESGINSYVYTPFTGVNSIGFNKTGYINRPESESITLARNETYNYSVWQSKRTINSTEINTKKKILNWSITTDITTETTTNGTLTIYPNTGNYTWTWKNGEQYINVTNIAFQITNDEKEITIQNLYARNITFVDNITAISIEPTCTQDGYAYTPDYLMHKNNTNITCALYGYEIRIFNNSNFPDTGVYNLTPNRLILNFSENVSGIIQAGDTYIEEFNATQIFIPQANVTEGYVKITFNLDGAGKYQQIFSYYNDQNTTIRDQILIQTVDLQQQIKVTGNTQALENARVCAKYPLNEEYFTTYCDYTDSTGEVIIQVNDQNTYQFCVQKEGYEPDCQLHYIPASNQETIVIDLVATSGKEGTNMINSNCGGVYLEDKTCTLEVTTYRPYYSICVNLTKIKNGIVNGTKVCTYDSTGETFIYSLSTQFTSYNVTTELDGSIKNIIIHLNATMNESSKVAFTEGDNDGKTMLERVKEEPILYIAIHLILTILGVISGNVFEKYFNGMGVYGVGIWFLMLGIGGFYVFFIPASIIIIYFIMEKVIPLFTN